MARISTLLALVALLALAATALAAPDRQTVMSSAAPAFDWEGPAATSLSPAPSEDTCTNPAPAGRYCDRTLIEVKEAGTLTVTISDWTADSDMDLFLVTSDSTGAFGEEVANSLNSGTDPEKVSSKLAPGFYLVFVNYFQTVQSGYKGVATFKVAAAPAPVEAPATPAPTTTAPTPAAGTLAVDLTAPTAKIAALRTGGLPVGVACTVTCKASLSLSVDARTARKLRVGKKAAVIGRATATIDSKQPAPVKVKLSAKVRKALAKAKTVKVTIKATVTDAPGGQKTARSLAATYKR